MTGKHLRRSSWFAPMVPRQHLAVGSLASAFLAGSALTPAAAQVLVGDGTVPCGTPYVVASGDTLSRVSERAYGDSQLYGFIADENWDALGGNPENVSVGMSLAIPCVDANGQVVTPEQAAASAAALDDVVAAEGTITPDQLDTLFGPVALFPDQVLTPVLVAVTFPLDVVKAGRFVEESSELSDDERAAEAAAQDWDDSVKELAAAFPDLVTRMSDHIDWTEQAGEAVVAQTDDVLASIQRLRGTAQDNGYLVDNEAQKIEEEGDKIVISSASPGVVYVPTYDPKVVYTTPVVGAPIYQYGYDYNHHADWRDALATGGIILGTAIVLDNIFDDDDHWHGWDINDNIDWDRGDITIDRGDINIDRGDRGDINIGGGDRVSIGNGDRPQIGNGNRPQFGGDRIGIGDSERPQIDRGDLANLGDRVGASGGLQAVTRPANRKPIANDASREMARQKIEARKSSGARPVTLPTSRPQAARPNASTRPATLPSRPLAARPSADGARAAIQNRPTTRAAPLSRPAAKRAPATKAKSRSTSFHKPSGGHRAAASAARGHKSKGGGGGRRGGGRRLR